MCLGTYHLSFTEIKCAPALHKYSIGRLKIPRIQFSLKNIHKWVINDYQVFADCYWMGKPQVYYYAVHPSSVMQILNL